MPRAVSRPTALLVLLLGEAAVSVFKNVCVKRHHGYNYKSTNVFIQTIYTAIKSMHYTYIKGTFQAFNQYIK